jgi:tetratricopeptide (TPR) repeat protein
MGSRTGFVVVLVLLAAYSCRPDDQRTDTMDPIEGMLAREDMPPEVVAQLDSGSLQFRADSFEAALSHYQRVTEMVPEAAAGWFGVYMAQQALGNSDAAAEALQKTQDSAADTMR